METLLKCNMHFLHKTAICALFAQVNQIHLSRFLRQLKYFGIYMNYNIFVLVYQHVQICAYSKPTKPMTTETPQLNEHNKQEFEPAHSAEHLLNQTMIRMFGCERSRNMHIERKKSKINYILTECPTAEQIAQIEQKMNDLIKDDLPVTYEFVTRDNIPDGVKLNKLPEDVSETLRLVRIGDYDICPCIGTHVGSTAEIGEFKITSTSWKEGDFRIVFKVFPPVL